MFKKISIIYYVAFALVLASSCLASWGSPYISWPGKQLIPLVYFLRGDLQSDLVASYSLNSPYSISASILSILLPNDHLMFLVSYVGGAIVLKAYVVGGSSALIGRTVVLIMSMARMKYSKIHLILISAILCIYFVLLGFVDGKFRYLSGAINAGWDYPLSDSLNPSGLSFAIVMTLALRLRFEKIKWERTALFFGVLLATLIHPVVPLFIFAFLIILYIFSIIFKYEFVGEIRLRLILTCGAWLIGCIAILYFFPQTAILIEDYYRIYVKERHPHHYQPSYYITLDLILKVLVNLLIVKIVAAFLMTSEERKAINILFFMMLSLFFMINTVQYIFVEIFHVSFMISLGITRLFGLYNFLYLVALVFIAVCLFGRISFFDFFVWSSNSSKFNSTIFGRPYAVYLGLFQFVSISLFVFFLFIQHQAIRQDDLHSLKREIDSLRPNEPYQLLVDGSIDNLREIAKIAVFNDTYFPFSTMGVEEWGRRNLLKKNFLECVHNSQDFRPCTSFLRNYSDVYLITEKNLKYSPSGYGIKISGVQYYLYGISELSK